MKKSTSVSRILGGVILTATALAACSDSPLSPARDPAFDMTGAGATVTQFTTTDLATGLVDPGLTEVRGPYLVVRGVVATSRITASDPRATGNAVITINEQLLLADGSGPAWGKFEVEADVGGVWTGSWTGQREPFGPGVWVATVNLVGRGRGGAIDGLEFKAEELIYTTADLSAGFIGYASGTILQPH
jgi:hypothetical protein